MQTNLKPAQIISVIIAALIICAILIVVVLRAKPETRATLPVNYGRSAL